MNKRLLNDVNLITYGIFGTCQLLSVILVLFQVWFFVEIIALELFDAPQSDYGFTTTNYLVMSLVVIVFRMGLAWVVTPILGLSSSDVKVTLRQRVNDHLFKLGPTFIQRERSGELVTSLTEGLDKLDAYFREYLPSVIVVVIFCPIIIITVGFIAFEVSAGMTFTVFLIVFALMFTGIAAGKRSRQQHAELGKMGADFLDVMRNLTALRLLNQSQAQGETIRQSSDNFRKSTMSVLRVAFLSSFALEMISTISIALIAVYVSGRLLNETMVFQHGLFILMILPEFYLPLRTFGVKFHTGKEGLANVERIYQLLDTPTPDFGVQTDLPMWQTIHFEDVHFSYTADRPALNGLSLTIKRGQTVAVVGDSGSGKSTVNALLLGFVQPQTGMIKLDDLPLDALSPEAWREGIAWVSQRPYLFHASIAENIRMGNQSATQEAIIHAAKQAGAHDFIMALPDGYDTPCGERGYSLSGGQAGRIAIARAFLKDADLLILDEPTANLDPDSEAIILKALDRLRSGRTVVNVAHRLDTIRDADVIVVLNEGRVAEMGDHASLMASGGRYASMRGDQ
jgi:ATP-binding cassette subfamily C protein CydD